MPWTPLTDPLAWSLHFSWPWTALAADAQVVWQQPHGAVTLFESPALDLVSAVLAAVGLVVTARRLPLGMTLFFICSWWSSTVKVLPGGLTNSEGRYMLQLLPLCVVPAGWMARWHPVARVAWMVACTILLIWYLTTFVLGGWVS
jgi:hypothetical protein